jgi:hypothetical protein
VQQRHAFQSLVISPGNYEGVQVPYTVIGQRMVFVNQ